MAHPTEDEIRRIRLALERISHAWGSIRVEYAATLDEATYSDDLNERLTNHLLLNPSCAEEPTLAQAWAAAVVAVRNVFFDDFAPWALNVASTFGIDRFPLDAPEPPHVERGSGHYELGESIRLLTATSDTREAGLRLILWAAASQDPQFCRRSSEYPMLIWSWISSLVEFSNGICRPHRELMDWVMCAFDHLAAASPEPSDGDPPVGSGVAISDQEDPHYELQRLPNRSAFEIRVRFGAEEGVAGGRPAERLSNLIRQERLHVLELGGDISGARSSHTTVAPDGIDMGEGEIQLPGVDVLVRDDLYAANERLAQIRADLETADPLEREGLEQERERLNNSVRRLTRSEPAQIGRAKDRIDKSLWRLKNGLLETMPDFVEHLDQAIQFDNRDSCYVYTPGEAVAWRLLGF